MKNFIVKYSITLLFLFSNHFLFSQNQHFTENKGQLPSQVLFKADFGNGAMFLENNTITYALVNPDNLQHSHVHGDNESNQKKAKELVNCHAYKVHFLESQTPEIQKQGVSTDYVNYFRGNDKSKWASRVRKYSEVNYKNLYNGVDLRVYTNENNYKYDFIVAPNSDVKQIRMKYDGVDKLSLKNGNLVIKTSVQEVIEYKPYVYQKIKGEKKSIKCNYKIENNILTFDLENYDKNKELIIDPVLVFSTYTGSSADNWGFTATYDNLGNVYAGGIVYEFGYPTSIGAYQTDYQGLWDIGIMKLSSNGKNRLYASYFGGSGCEMPHSLIVNEFNDLLIFGTTGSSDFPISNNAYDKTFNGGTSISYDGGSITFPNGSDLYISRLSENGDDLIASTYVGGTKNDGLNYKSYIENSSIVYMHGNDSLYYNYADGARGEIITDSDNNIYIGTTTFSSDFPTTSAAFQPNLKGKQEGLVFKMDANLSNLMWSSYLGGTEDDAVYSIDVDNINGVYATGGTVSHDFPYSATAYNKSFNGGNTDGFLTYISSDGKQINASTFFGSNEYDQSFNVKLDKFNYPHIVGQTKASGSTLVHNAQFNEPNSGQFIAKFKPDLSDIVWSTVFGSGNGKPNISITAFTVDVCNRIYLAGWGREWTYFSTWDAIEGTKNMTITNDAYQSVTDGQDFYILVMADDASSLDYATFIGEQHNDWCSNSGRDHVDGGTSRFDKRGNIYQSVCASCGGCDEFPTSNGAWSSTNDSYNCNNAVFRFSFMEDIATADFSQPNTGCAPYTVNFNNLSMGTNFIWNFGDGSANSTLKNPTHTYTTSGKYTITLISSDPTTCNLTDTIKKQITILDNTSVTNPKISICPNASVQIGVSPSSDSQIQYSWTPTTGLNNPNIANPFATPTSTTTYTLKITNGSCTETIIQIVEIIPNNIQITSDSFKDICKGESITLTASSNQKNTDLVWATDINFTQTIVPNINDSSTSVNPSSTTTYYIKGIAPNCNFFDVTSVKVNVHESKISVGNDKQICFGDSVQLNVQNLVSGDVLTYSWTPISTILSGANTSKPLVKPNAETTYTINVSNQYNCTATDNIVVKVDKIEVDSTLKNITCNGKNDGEISILPIGGTSPYIYLWSNSKTSSTISNLQEGNYNVIIIDALSCRKEMSFTLVEPTKLESNLVDTLHIPCDGTCNGSVTVVASGGISPYSYKWSTGKTSDKISKLCIGKYLVTVSDANKCESYDSFTVVDPSDIIVTTKIDVPLLCKGDCNGAVSVHATFGVLDYNHYWSNDEKSNMISSLCSGWYYDTLVDGMGCVRPMSIFLPEPTALNVSTSYDSILCNGNKTNIFTTVSGATPNYSYKWNNNETNSSISNVGAGTYSLTISDNNNCDTTLTILITEPEKLVFDSIVSPTKCTQSCDGKIEISTNGGVKPYTYLWSNSMSDSVIVNLCEGNYSVTITDKNNCAINQSFDIKNQNFVPELNITASDSVIYQGEDVQFTATFNENYHYNWTPTQTLNNYSIYNPLASPIVETTYYLDIYDDKNCVNIDSVFIKVDDFVCDVPFVFVPNAFTPDGDGNNDELLVYSKVTTEIYFAVYDRWGEKVFETSDINQGWNGKFKKKELDPAVYVYYLKATCVNGQEIVLKGNVTLIR